MIKILSLGIVLLSLSPKGYAEGEFSMDVLKSKIRPYLEKTIGIELSNEILGEDSTGIVFPVIPEITGNAKSTEIYDKRDSETSKYSKAQMDQYNYDFIVEIYHVTKELPATQSEISRWMNVMNQGGSHEGVYRAMVLDNAYYNLEQTENTVNKKTVDFSAQYLERYIGSRIKKTSLEKSNFYTLKRATLEKTLDVIDVLSKKPDDFLNWYAILSSELAINFPNAFSQRVRQLKGKREHKRWAKSVPTQVLKAEVIIKLHKILNYLNQ